MDNKKQVGASSFDHLFGPKDSSSSSSTSTGIFGSIFPPPSKVAGRDSGILGNHAGSGKYSNSDNVAHKDKGYKSSSDTSSKGKGSIYQNETPEPCYFSSSIYYGGQENYSPRTKNSSDTQHFFKKDEGNEELNGNDPNSASRGNWWQGSLYY